MKFKQNTVVSSLHAQMALVLYHADLIHEELTGDELTVTSVNDGRHMPGSKHYTGEAVDLRTWSLKNDQRVAEFIHRLATAIGDNFDIVLEPTHIHVEYDPQTSAQNQTRGPESTQETF